MPEFTVFKGTDEGVPRKSITKRPDQLVGDQVLLKVTASGVCGTDLHFLKKDMVLGHEGVGIVEQTGPDVKFLKKGDRVGWGYETDSCGLCLECLSGNETFCDQRAMYGSASPDQGSFSTGAIWREAFLHPIPDELSDEDAAPLQCGGATVYTTLVDAKPNETVGVLGVGGLGHLAIQYAAKMGCRVVVLSGTDSKRDQALELGAHKFIAMKGLDTNKLDDIWPISRLLVTSSAQPAWETLLPLLSPRAKIYPLSVSSGNFVIPYMPLIAKGITVQGSLVATRAVHREMLAFAAAHKVKPVVQTFPMTEEGIKEALDRLDQGKITYRAVLLAQILLLGVILEGATAVDLHTCNIEVQSRLDSGNLSYNDPIFHHNGSTYMSQRGSLALTLEGCTSTCPKPNFDLYDDMWQRLLTWLVPALLLIGNVHMPRIGKRNRLSVILHFLGDPIDAMWSLATKAELWSRFYRSALRATPGGPRQLPMTRALAAVLSSFEELTGDMAAVHEALNNIIDEAKVRLSSEDLEYILMETADELVDSRSNEVICTVLVIINYLWAVLAALVPQVGGPQSSQPGGRIGTAMFLSWLVTAVLLSNTLSGFTSRRTCLRIMERYYRTLQGNKRDLNYFSTYSRPQSLVNWPSPDERSPTSSMRDDFIDAQPWSGGVYCYRPSKRLARSGSKEDRSPFTLLLLSTAPVVVSSVSAFVIIWFTPTIGLGCRTLWVLGLTIGLILSPLLTWIISKMTTGKLAWYLTTVKDAIIAGAVVIVIIVSSIGFFNTCWCWSGVYSRGRDEAYIDLDPISEREYNLHHLYPAMVGACLGLQLVVYMVMHRVMRVGGLVFRPHEDDKMESYRRIHGLGSPPLNGREMKTPARPTHFRHVSESSQAAEDAALLPEPALSPYFGPVSSRGSDRPLLESVSRWIGERL
ncbi:alcohol dehydrogenase [Paramyrothecium foliicola]|nr:alcohol dehydrogenase [Paramyrothecium foliicola]